MMDTSFDVIWWITAVEIPVVTALWWLIWRTRRDHESSLNRQRHHLDTAVAQAREQLAAYKLEVAKSYASLGQLKDLEARLTQHLLRIEAKLDAQPSPERRAS